MITEKVLVLLVLVTSIPLAFTRLTSVRGGFFSNDVIKGRHHFHKIHHVQVLENPVNTRSYKSEIKVVDIDGNEQGTRNEQYQVENQQEPKVVIVDMEGNELGSPNEQYQVGNQQETEIVIVDINGNVENLDNDKYQVENEDNHETVVHSRNNYPTIQVTDVSAQQVDSQNVKYNVRDQQYPKAGKLKSFFRNSISRTQSEDDYVNKVDSEMNNNGLRVEKISAIKTATKNRGPDENSIIVNDSENQIDSDVDDFPETASDKKNTIPETPRINNDSENEVDSDVDDFPETKPANNENNIPETPRIINESENEVDAPSYEVCQTVQCRKLAEEFTRSMNNSVDPCEDFYEFACGGWESTNPRPSYAAVWSRNSMVEYSTYRDIKAILESESRSDEIKPVKQAKEWYRSCMNTERREERGLEPILSIMLRVGGWPMIMNQGEWHENKYTWKRVQQYYARLTGSHTFYNIWPTYRSEGDAFGNITIEGRKFFDQDDILSWILQENKFSHFSAIVRVAEMFVKYNRASVPKRRLLGEARDVLLFQEALAKLIAETEEDTAVSFEDLNAWYNYNDETHTMSDNLESETNLMSVVQNVFNFANITVDPSTPVYIRKPTYVRGIGALLKRTSPRTIVNYIHWKFIQKVWLFSNEKTRRVFSERILLRLFGVSGEVPRWLACIKEIKMKQAISYAYVKKYWPWKSTKSEEIEEIIENIREGLKKKIDNSNWMNSESKTLTKKKLKVIKNIVGFPEWYTNDTAIINYYEGLEIGPDYLENHLNYMRYAEIQNLKRYVMTAPEETHFGAEDDSPITVNAYFDQSKNFAVYPAANFQPPFFGIDYPNSVNYGMTGMLIGHEIGHGFDNCGITHGDDGKRTQLDEMVLRSYWERVDCFVDQYDEYNGNPKVNNGTKCNRRDDNKNKSDGQRTASENIADNTGLEAVFQAYKKLIKDKYANGDIRLPGLEQFTDAQLFFLSYAESWCEVETPQYKQYVKKANDEHSIAKLRVIGPVSNTKGFAKAFNCPIGSPMNPVNKCSVWNKPDTDINQVPKMENLHSRRKQWKNLMYKPTTFI